MRPDRLPPCAHAPRKRSVTIAGHPTSVSLEPIFWAALERVAHERSLPLSALIARIDAAQIDAARPPNLASAIRVWLFAACCKPEPPDPLAQPGTLIGRAAERTRRAHVREAAVR